MCSPSPKPIPNLSNRRYFDFNDPVITNRTMLTVGRIFVISGTSDADSKIVMRIAAYPNPTSNHAVLELLDDSGATTLKKFQLFNATGQLLRQATFTRNRYEWKRNELNAGLYWFRVEQSGQTIGTGCIVIQ
jgi:Secretion system C-terminal sorting domain